MDRRRGTLGPTGAALLALVVACAEPVRVDPDAGTARPGDEVLEELVARVETARGIPARRPIDVRVIAPSALPALLRESLAARSTPAEIRAYEEGLVTVGLWPAERSLVDEYIAVMGEEVVGFYRVDQRALFVVSDSRASFSEWLVSVWQRHDLMSQLALSHELVHLLQHQRYPRLLEDDATYLHHDDLALAVQAAYEGDAMWFGTRAVDPSLLPVLAMETELSPQLEGADGALGQAPRLLRELVQFPYRQGFRLAAGEGAALLDDPPASTEQVLHPDRRFADFAVLDLSRLWDRLPEGCTPVFENTMGELEVRILLEELSASAAPKAAEGWDGDRYLAARCNGRRALLWWTVWDSPADAREFADAYGAVAGGLAARTGASPLRLAVRGDEVVVATSELFSLAGSGDASPRRARVRSVARLLDFFTLDTAVEQRATGGSR